MSSEVQGMTQQEIITQNMPKEFVKKRYYTLADVKRHNRSVDMWVVLFDQVLDLTKTIQTNFTSGLCKPLIDYAGKDVTHWFSRKTGEPKTRVNPDNGYTEYYFPDGRFLHCPDSIPETRDLELNMGSTETETNIEVPWWRDRNLVLGKLTQRSRKIRIINMLTHQEDIIEVVFRKFAEIAKKVKQKLCRQRDIRKMAQFKAWLRRADLRLPVPHRNEQVCPVCTFSLFCYDSILTPTNNRRSPVKKQFSRFRNVTKNSTSTLPPTPGKL